MTAKHRFSAKGYGRSAKGCQYKSLVKGGCAVRYAAKGTLKLRHCMIELAIYEKIYKSFVNYQINANFAAIH